MSSVFLIGNVQQISKTFDELAEIRKTMPANFEMRYNYLYSVFLLLGEQMSDEELKDFHDKLNQLNQEKVRWSKQLQSHFQEYADVFDLEIRRWFVKNKDRFSGK